MVSCFTEHTGFVAGFSPLSRIPRPGFFYSLIFLDGLALAGIAASTFFFGHPLTCNGRNLGYRRKTFDDAGGFEAIGAFVSGDDDLLMHQVRRRTTWKMVYSLDPSTFVPSIPAKTLKAFIAQRTRHASKGRFYPVSLKAVLAAFYLFNLLLLTAPLLPGPPAAFLGVLLIKMAAEWLFLSRTAAVFQQKAALKVFPLAALLHIPYVVILGLWGQFGRFKWKDAYFRTKEKAV
jgi:hypothetical protein